MKTDAKWYDDFIDGMMWMFLSLMAVCLIAFLLILGWCNPWAALYGLALVFLIFVLPAMRASWRMYKRTKKVKT